MECFDWSDNSFSSTNLMLYVSQRDEMAVKCRTLAMLKAVEQEDPECYYNNLDDNTYTYNWAWDLLDDCNQNIYWTFFLDLCRDNITRITGPFSSIFAETTLLELRGLLLIMMPVLSFT